MEEQIALFLSRFKELKRRINNSPKNLSWLTAEQKDLQDLCFELAGNYQSIAKSMATKTDKHTFITIPFENDWKEYELNYKKHVSKAAEPAKERSVNELKSLLKDIEDDYIKSGKSKEEYDQFIYKWLENLGPIGSLFDPLIDDPPSLLEGIKDHLHDKIANKDSENEFFDKALGAWYFYEKSIGLDLEGIYKRWKQSPELFIPMRIQATTNTKPLIELYDEAVRTYVFGNKVASMTMCRALLEHILQKYYGFQADDLDKLIILAEERFPNFKKLHLRNKKNLANRILHNYERKSDIEDKSVVEFLNNIKYLVQRISGKGR